MDGTVTPVSDVTTTGEKAAWVQAWASIAAVMLTLGGLVFVIVQITFAKEQFLAYKAERATDRLEKLHTEWDSPTMLAWRAAAASDYPRETPYLKQIFDFFERLSIAKKKGIVSGEDVDLYFQTDMLAYWCGFENVVKQKRISLGEDPDKSTLWGEFQKSVAEMKERNHVQCLTEADLQVLMAREKVRFSALTGSVAIPATKQSNQ